MQATFRPVEENKIRIWSNLNLGFGTPKVLNPEKTSFGCSSVIVTSISEELYFEYYDSIDLLLDIAEKWFEEKGAWLKRKNLAEMKNLLKSPLDFSSDDPTWILMVQNAFDVAENVWKLQSICLPISNLLFGSKCFWFCWKWMEISINVSADYEFAF